MKYHNYYYYYCSIIIAIDKQVSANGVSLIMSPRTNVIVLGLEHGVRDHVPLWYRYYEHV